MTIFMLYGFIGFLTSCALAYFDDTKTMRYFKASLFMHPIGLLSVIVAVTLCIHCYFTNN